MLVITRGYPGSAPQLRKEVPQLPVEPVEPLKEDGSGGVERARCVVWNVMDFKYIYIYI